MSSRLTNKKSLSHSSHKKFSKKKSQIHPQILDAYGINKKTHKKKNKLKIEISQTDNHKTSTYQFPQFNIKYVQKQQKKDDKQKINLTKDKNSQLTQKIKENSLIQGITYRKKEEKLKNEPIKEEQDLGTEKDRCINKSPLKIDKQLMKFELQQQFNRAQRGKQNNKQQFYLEEKKIQDKIKQYINKKQSKQQKNIDIPKKQQKQLYSLFISSVKKVFTILDIFNRGKIAEVNINKWIPQFSLYFLGQIFQKIKQYRLVLTEQEFIDYCKPLYKQSNYQDIKQFILCVEKAQVPLKTSINVPNQAQKNGPLQQRFLNQRLNSSQKGIGKENKHQSNLDELLNIINSKQIQLNLKIKQIKNKKDSILQQKSVNESFKKIKNQLIKIKMAQSEISKSMFSEVENQELRKSIENPSRFQSQKQHMKLSQQIQKRYEILKNYQKQHYSKENQICNTNENELVPNFTFQIPSQDKPYHYNVIQERKIHKNGTKIEKQMNNTSDLIAKRSKGEFMNNLTDRLIQKYNRDKYDKDIKKDAKSYRHFDESDKIDKLNNKLEQYLKLNEKKIKNSKIFLLQNSFDNK